ncbi:MAG: dienelactone hydrolase family protein [Cyclobacteriaceae bacterium]
MSIQAIDGQSFENIKLNNGTTLSYLIETTEISADETSNLVVALHWGWERSKPVSDTHVIDFHEKFAKKAVKLENTYLVSVKCPYSRWDNDLSVKAIDELLEKLLEKYEIDESSMALMGYSAGGIGCWYYLQRNPNNIFKLVIPIAARQPNETFNLENQSIAIIHGSSDEYVDLKNIRQFFSVLKEVNPNANLIVAPGAGHMNFSEYASRASNILSSLDYKYQ